MATDAAGEISELKAKLASIEAVLDPDTMLKEADGLRVRAADPALWEDPEQGQAITRPGSPTSTASWPGWIACASSSTTPR